MRLVRADQQETVGLSESTKRLHVRQSPGSFPDRINHALGLRERPHTIGLVIIRLVTCPDEVEPHTRGEGGVCRAQTSEGAEQRADKGTCTGQKSADIA
jgi:hypothetical protein